MNEAVVISAASHFKFSGKFVNYFLSENGHINNTYFFLYRQEDGSIKRYILQRVNTNVFKNPYQVMENIKNVTEFIKEKLEKNGGDVKRGVLTLVESTEGNVYYVDDHGYFWRAYVVVEDTITVSSAESPEKFYKVGYAFGQFQMQLSDFPAEKLYETIPNFHNTVSRYADFEAAVLADPMGRVREIEDEINFVRQRHNICSFIMDGIQSGKFPLRVTHNDTKMDNILVDRETGEGVCVIDLDTVMPGSVLNDFGDAIRFGASSAAEDETDLDEVYVDIKMFEGFARGFIKGLENSLNEDELKALPMGAVILTFETGMRFLTDYINGDVYFRIHRENHNLERARNQFKLVEDMEMKMPKLNKIIKNIMAGK